MKTKDREVHNYLKSLGWNYYEQNEDSPKISGIVMGQDCFGDTWYALNKEIGFNTGSNFYLSFKNNTMLDEPVLIHIFENTYSSYSQPKFMSEYRLETLTELPILMKFKRII